MIIPGQQSLQRSRRWRLGIVKLATRTQYYATSNDKFILDVVYTIEIYNLNKDIFCVYSLQQNSSDNRSRHYEYWTKLVLKMFTSHLIVGVNKKIGYKWKN